VARLFRVGASFLPVILFVLSTGCYWRFSQSREVLMGICPVERVSDIALTILSREREVV